MGSRVGVIKMVAIRLGLTVEQYEAKVAAGLKWCGNCKEWQDVTLFGPDQTRGDGLRTTCQPTTRYKATPWADMDKVKTNARRAVGKRVQRGRLPHPNTVPCTDCAAAWSEGKSRHEYDHHLGYEGGHRWDVEPVCNLCHKAREKERRCTGKSQASTISTEMETPAAA